MLHARKRSGRMADLWDSLKEEIYNILRPTETTNGLIMLPPVVDEAILTICIVWPLFSLLSELARRSDWKTRLWKELRSSRQAVDQIGDKVDSQADTLYHQVRALESGQQHLTQLIHKIIPVVEVSSRIITARHQTGAEGGEQVPLLSLPPLPGSSPLSQRPSVVRVPRSKAMPPEGYPRLEALLNHAYSLGLTSKELSQEMLNAVADGLRTEAFYLQVWTAAIAQADPRPTRRDGSNASADGSLDSAGGSFLSNGDSQEGKGSREVFKRKERRMSATWR